MCPGRHVANNTLFIEMATVLWTMRLEAVKGPDGSLIKPNPNAEEEHGIFSSVLQSVKTIFRIHKT